MGQATDGETLSTFIVANPRDSTIKFLGPEKKSDEDRTSLLAGILHSDLFMNWLKSISSSKYLLRSKFSTTRPWNAESSIVQGSNYRKTEQ